MTILLDTGALTTPHSKQVAVGTTTIDTTPSERVVYPHNKEQFLVVKHGEMMVLTAYGLVDQSALVKKVLLSNSVPELGTGGCNPIITSAQSTVLNRVEVPCYELGPCSPLVVIDIPGVYAVAPEEDPRGEVVITAMSYKLQSSGPKCSCGCTPTVELGV